MKLPFLNTVRRHSVTTVGFKGINRRSPVVSDGELFDTENMSLSRSPALSTRPHRTLIREQTSFVMENIHCPVLFASDKLVTVMPAKQRQEPSVIYDVYYGDEHIGSLERLPTSIVEFQGQIVFFPEKKIYSKKTGIFSDFGSGSYPDDSGSVPDIDYATVLDNRVFGVGTSYDESGKTVSSLYACALGNINDWTTFSQDGEVAEWGAYRVDVASAGEFTGIASFLGHVVIFKQSEMLELYGQYPSNFSLSSLSKIGCVDSASITELGGRLYFASSDGIMSYGGGLPGCISDKIATELGYSGSGNSAQYRVPMGNDGRVLYIGLNVDGKGEIFTYLPDKARFIKEDGISATSFARIGDELYMACARDSESVPMGTDCAVYRIGEGNDTFSWSLKTPARHENASVKKRPVAVAACIVPMGEAVTVELAVSDQRGIIKSRAFKRVVARDTVRVPIIMDAQESFSITVSGRGDAVIPYIEWVYTQGG